MFDPSASASAVPPGPARDPHPSVVTLRGWLAELGALAREVSDADRIDQLRALEELKNAAAAAQAQVAVDLDASQRRVQAAAGVPATDLGRGVAGQIGLARRESPHKGARYLGLAKVLHAEMPHTRAAMAAGWLSEWRATLLARETACLSREHRGVVDQTLAGHRAGELQAWGDRRLTTEAAKLAYQLDPDAVLARIRHAENQRSVSSRPAPDTMAYLTALLPAAQAVACYATLLKAAATARAAGDPRSRGQVMADTLVELVTGQKTAAATPVEIQLVVTDHTLFANLGNPPDQDTCHHPDGDHTDGDDTGHDTDDEAADRVRDDDHAEADPAEQGPGGPPADPHGDPREEPGYLHGYGIVPAGWIRDLIATLPAVTQVWLRRVYAHPQTGDLVAMDARARTFRHGIRRLLVTRDRICRTPYCGAPIRHADHPIGHARGGRTSRDNGQGLCEACNYAKEAPGWTARPVPAARHTVRTTTPTGHVYDSTAAPLPGHYPHPYTPAPPQHDTRPEDPLSAPALEALWTHLDQYAA